MRELDPVYPRHKPDGSAGSKKPFDDGDQIFDVFGVDRLAEHRATFDWPDGVRSDSSR
jgi:hypothetical protein